MIPLKQSTAITVPFFAHDANGDAVTGMVDGGFTKRISKNGAAFGAMTVTITEMENGWYSFPLSASHSDTLGILTILFTNASSKQINLQWRVSARLPDDLAYPTTTGRAIDVTTGGAVGIDWANIEGQGTSVDLSDTAINLVDTATDVTNGVGITATAVDNIWDEDIVAAHGSADTSGLILSELSKRNITWATAVVAGSALDQIADDGTASYDRTTDSLQANRDKLTDIETDTAEIGAAGDGLTNIDLPNQTMDITGSLSGSVGSVTGAVDSVTNAVGSVTGNVGGNVTGSIGSLAAQAKTDVNAEVDTALSDIDLQYLVNTALPTNWATDVTANSALDQMADDGTAGYDRTTDSLQASRDKLTDIETDTGEIGAAGAGLSNIDLPDQTMNITGNLSGSVGSVSGNVDGNVTGSVGSVSGHTNQTGDNFARIGVNGAGLTNIDLPNQTMDITGSLSGSVGSVTGAVGSVTGAVGSVTGNVGGNVVGSVDSVTNAVGSVTGNVGGNVTGSVGSVAAGGVTASSIATDAIGSDELAASAAQKIRDEILPTQNVAFNNIEFLWVAASDHVTPVTGASTTSVTRSIDGGGFGAATGTLAEVGNGIYQFDASQADMNGGIITFRFVATGGTPGAPDDAFLTIVTGGGV